MQFSILPAALVLGATSLVAADPQIVKVGDGGLTFSPNVINATVGSTIEFHFYPQKHSVAQGSFASPCSPLSNSSFFSGGFATASGVNSTTFTLTVNDTNPIYFYCAYPGHCGQGMVGIVNPPTDPTQGITAYVSAAGGKSTTPPLKAQGGIIAVNAALASNSTATPTTSGSGSSPSSGTGSGTSASASATGKSAGVLARGEVAWGVVGAVMGLWGFLI